MKAMFKRSLVAAAMVVGLAAPITIVSNGTASAWSTYTAKGQIGFVDTQGKPTAYLQNGRGWMAAPQIWVGKTPNIAWGTRQQVIVTVGLERWNGQAWTTTNQKTSGTYTIAELEEMILVSPSPLWAASPGYHRYYINVQWPWMYGKNYGVFGVFSSLTSDIACTFRCTGQNGYVWLP